MKWLRGMKYVDARFLGYNLVMAATAAAILLTIASGTHVFASKTERLSSEAFQLGALDRSMGRILRILLDAETGQRGFLLTHDEGYLQPFRDARQRFDDEFQQLRRQIAQLPEETRLPDIGRLGSLTQEKFAELQRVVDLARAGDDRGALEEVRSHLGRSLMDSLRAFAADFQNLTGDLRAARIDEMRDSAGMLTLLTTLGAGTILVLSILALVLILHHTREIEQARGELALANAELEDRVIERTRELVLTNAELQRYGYIVSHDLRAPLVNIMGFTGELARATATFTAYLDRVRPDRADPSVAAVYTAIQADIPEAMGFIAASLRRMDALIGEILKLSRLGRAPLVPETIDMADLVVDCVANIHHRLESAGGRAEVRAPLPILVSDRFSLQQIFTNLLDNAVKYAAPDRPGHIVVRGSTVGALALFEIEDNGRGIAPADHERVFDLFRRAGLQDQPGEGIGLTHVRTLVRRLGGDITIVSDGRTGTIFRLTLARDLRTRLKSDER